MAIKFLANLDKGVKSPVYIYTRPNSSGNRSYCANSDLYSNRISSFATRKLSPEEAKRQAACYKY